MKYSLKAIPCYGINTDSLGQYLTGLGLLSAISGKWPNVRACWRSGYMILLGQDLTCEKIRQYLLCDWQMTPYERWWSDAQKKDSQAKNQATLNIRRERNNKNMQSVHILDAHIAGIVCNQFNPILGTGGNIGRRDFAKLQSNAHAQIQKDSDRSEFWLDFTLTGNNTVDLPKLSSAGTWFVYANKTYNSGQEWFREGKISPWSVLLALEGAFMLTGNINKRLGPGAGSYAAFPFISESRQAVTPGEIGSLKAEFWAPLWQYPATLVEVRSLFQRGLARLGNRDAKAPHEFALAARAAGVDAGVTEFIRYELRSTTSTQYQEAIPRHHIKVAAPSYSSPATHAQMNDAELLVQLIESKWLDRLPKDSRQKGKYSGLRGPVESALVDISEEPDNAELWRNLLLLLAKTQLRVDRNRSWREKCMPLPLLHPGWFYKAWPEPVHDEIHIARAIASIDSYTHYPLRLNIFGVKANKSGQYFFPESIPRRVVWHDGNPMRLYSDIVQRRLIDTKPTEPAPFHALCPCSQMHLQQFLMRTLDVDEITRWIPVLSLIDWSACEVASTSHHSQTCVLSGMSLLYGYFRPFFTEGDIYMDRKKPLFTARNRPRSGLARRLFQLLQYGQFDEAVQLAKNTWLANGLSVITPPKRLKIDGELLAAALLLPLPNHEVGLMFREWLKPVKSTAF